MATAAASSTRQVSRGQADRRREASRHRAVMQLKRLRLVALLVILTLYLGMLYIGPEVILPSQSGDAESIATLSLRSDEMNSYHGYAAMAFIYSKTTALIRYLILIALASLFFHYFTRKMNSSLQFSIAIFISVTPILLFLCYFVKDTMYIPFVIIALTALTKVRNNVVACLIVALSYLVYALIFRSYFSIVALIFINLVVYTKLPITFKLFAVVLVVAVLPFVPVEIYSVLQDQRDFVNQGRIGFSASGYRTAFVNLMPTEGAVSFLINYGYGVIRLNFPVFFSAGPKEIFMMANIAVIALLAIVGLRSPDSRVWRPALLFVAHFLTLMLFEPDLGSYLRHIATSLPLLGPALALIDIRPAAERSVRQVGALAPRPPRQRFVETASIARLQ